MPIQLFLLKTPRLEIDKQPFEFSRRKALILLAYLALYPVEHARDMLATLFWQDSDSEAARLSLRVTVSELRKVLGESALQGSRQTLQLAPDFPLWLDVFAFQRAAASSTPEDWQMALQLYSGDFLPDLDADWVLEWRTRLRQLYIETLLRLTVHQRSQAEYTSAIELARRVLTIEPTNESAHQQIMIGYEALNQPAAALKQYETCAASLKKISGALPSAETQVIFQRLQKNTARSNRPTPQSNLPTPLTSFIGRESEMETVESLLSPLQHDQQPARLVTLTGAGGSGKTRLSIQSAAELVDAFRDGICWVELAALTRAEDVAFQVARACGITESSSEPIEKTLLAALQPRQLLLVLDNCEHLITACAKIVKSLLENCPLVQILATSREGLGLAGEYIYPVPTLRFPESDQTAPETALRFEGVRLFVERAQSMVPSFQLDSTNSPAILSICRRLDGIPLAIELAAARLKMLTPAQIVERLNSRFNLLVSADRSALPRQKTLTALIDWSYDLLAEDERNLLRSLAVFRGGAAIDAIEAVCGEKKDETRIQNPSEFILLNLVNKSLLIEDSQAGRYRMLETIRQYASEKLAQTDDAAGLNQRHLEYFLALAERAEPELNGPQLAIWLRRLDADLDNLRGALEWSLNQAPQTGLRLASALLFYWMAHNDVHEGIEWLLQLLEKPSVTVRDETYAKALAALSYLYEAQLEALLAEVPAQEALNIYRELGNQHGEAFALYLLGTALCGHDDYSAGRPLIFESLALYRKLDDKFGMAETLFILGNFIDDHDPERAHAYMTESLEIAREMGDLIGIASRLANLGRIAYRMEDYVSARAYLTEALQHYRNLNRSDVYFVIESIGELALREGKYDEAQAYFEEAIALAQSSGRSASNYWISSFLGFVSLYQENFTRARALFIEAQQGFYKTGLKIGVAYTMEGLASLALAQNQPHHAARLFAWADATRELVQNPRPPVEQAGVERELNTIRAQMDEATFADAQREGREMGIEQAMGVAEKETVDRRP